MPTFIRVPFIRAESSRNQPSRIQASRPRDRLSHVPAGRRDWNALIKSPLLLVTASLTVAIVLLVTFLIATGTRDGSRRAPVSIGWSDLPRHKCSTNCG